MKKKTPFATKEHNLSGYAALDFTGRDNFKAFALKFAACDPQRFEPMALRLYAKKSEPVITLFALDKRKYEENKMPKGKLPVRKFKLSLSFADFLKQVKQFDFTVTDKDVEIERFVVSK